MKWVPVFVPIALGVGIMIGAVIADHRGYLTPRTQVVAVCDQRGNTVYTTSSGSIFVLEGCR